MRRVMEIPLFPLRSVLCPGVALPLHIFEERYRLMVNRCIELGQPFGVVLLRDGHEVGPLRGQVATVGTTAVIRRAGAYPDGRLDIMTVGQQRFHLEEVDNVSQPYLVGEVSLLEEPLGPAAEVEARAAEVGQRFLRYLELLQPSGDSEGPEIEIEFEIEVDEEEPATNEPAETPTTLEGLLATGEPDQLGQPDQPGDPAEAADAAVRELDGADLSVEQRRELLMAAARRLTGTDDPTALSYVLTALVQIDLETRQALLEAPDTATRLRGLERLLGRESWFLQQGLRPVIVDPKQWGSLRT
jgi:Lon protease-like protein